MIRVEPSESVVPRESGAPERLLGELLEDAELETMSAIIPDWCRLMVGGPYGLL